MQRRRPRRRRRRTRWQIYGAAGRQLAKDVYKLKQIVNAEKHYHDLLQSSTSVTWAGYKANLAAVAAGNSDTTRKGDSLKYHDVKIEGMISFNTASSVSYSVISLYLVYYPTVPSAGTDIDDLLEYTATSYAPFSPKNHDQRFDCRILHKRTVYVSPDTDVRRFKIYHKFRKNEHENFDGNTTTILKGALYLFAISDYNSGNPSPPQLHFVSRMHFWDN